MIYVRMKVEKHSTPRFFMDSITLCQYVVKIQKFLLDAFGLRN